MDMGHALLLQKGLPKKAAKRRQGTFTNGLMWAVARACIAMLYIQSVNLKLSVSRDDPRGARVGVGNMTMIRRGYSFGKTYSLSGARAARGVWTISSPCSETYSCFAFQFARQTRTFARAITL